MTLDFTNKIDEREEIMLGEEYDGVQCANMYLPLFQIEEMYARTEMSKEYPFEDLSEDTTMNTYANIDAKGEVFIALFTQDDYGVVGYQSDIVPLNDDEKASLKKDMERVAKVHGLTLEEICKQVASFEEEEERSALEELDNMSEEELNALPVSVVENGREVIYPNAEAMEQDEVLNAIAVSNVEIARAELYEDDEAATGQEHDEPSEEEKLEEEASAEIDISDVEIDTSFDLIDIDKDFSLPLLLTDEQAKILYDRTVGDGEYDKLPERAEKSAYMFIDANKALVVNFVVDNNNDIDETSLAINGGEELDLMARYSDVIKERLKKEYESGNITANEVKRYFNDTNVYHFEDSSRAITFLGAEVQPDAIQCPLSEFQEAYRKNYKLLYNNDELQAQVAHEFGDIDEYARNNHKAVAEFATYRMDGLTSDRELLAFAMTLQAYGYERPDPAQEQKKAAQIVNKLLNYDCIRDRTTGMTPEAEIEFIVKNLEIDVNSVHNTFGYSNEQISNALSNSRDLKNIASNFDIEVSNAYATTRENLEITANNVFDYICNTENLNPKGQLDLLLNKLKIDREDVKDIFGYSDKHIDKALHEKQNVKDK